MRVRRNVPQFTIVFSSGVVNGFWATFHRFLRFFSGFLPKQSENSPIYADSRARDPTKGAFRKCTRGAASANRFAISLTSFGSVASSGPSVAESPHLRHAIRSAAGESAGKPRGGRFIGLPS